MEKVLKDARSFKSNINRRNSLEWIAAGALVPVFVTRAASAPSVWSQLMYVELVFALIFIAAVLFYKGRLRKDPEAGLSTEAFLQSQKFNIQKQIQLLSKARYWYVAPLFLGMLGLGLERVITNWNPERLPWSQLIFLLTLLPMAFGIIWLNEKVAVKKLRLQLESLS